MTYRGRLIFPILADIYRLDLAAINTASGFDSVYKEIKLSATSDGLGASARLEMAVVQIPMQFEPSAIRRLHAIASGDDPDSKIVGCMHFADLEALSLVDSTTGIAKIKRGDRLGALRRMDGVLIETVTADDLVTVTEALPITGLNGYRNLLQVTFEARDGGK